MTEFNQTFPFEEIRSSTGDYFASVEEARAFGYDDDQIWSVVESEGAWTFGPPHHYVNVIGYVATKERHDGQTYYHEDDQFENEG